MKPYPVLVPIHHTTNWELCRPLPFQVHGEDYIVPAGFVTDLASIPWFFWRIIRPGDPRLARGAVPHDFVYRSEGHLGIPRERIDQYFLYTIIEDGYSPKKSNLAYSMLRKFGGFNWA